MSKWRAEYAYLGRYLGTGAINTLAGFAVIFAMMWVGFSPVVANLLGYGFGFVLGFLMSKKLVFRSHGAVLGEGMRYVIAFVCAYLLNLGALQVSLQHLGISAIFAQIAAAAVFTSSMYVMSRFYAFAPARK